MKRITLIVAALALLVAPSVFAQKFYGADYNAKKEITFKGSILEVERHLVGTDASYHIRVKGEKATYDVQLAPADFLKEGNIRFTPGEEVTIIGAKARFEDADVVVARQVTRGAEVIVLRDETGHPAWDKAERAVR